MSLLTFLALGDSYTIGEAVLPQHRWVHQLRLALEAKGLFFTVPGTVAKTGWTSSELHAAIEEEGIRGPYDLVTLLIGVNNQYRGESLAAYETEFQTLLKTAILLADGEPQHVLVMSIPDWGQTPFAEGRDLAQISREIDDFNAINRRISAELEVRYADINPISKQAKNQAELTAEDRLHPSKEMYSLWTKIALEALNGYR